MTSLVTLSDAAAFHLKELISKSINPVLGLRIAVKNSGCSGLSYALELASERQNNEEMIEDKGVKIFIDQSIIMFLVGTEVDYQRNKLGSSFIFNNPNETARCGCGESFRV